MTAHIGFNTVRRRSSCTLPAVEDHPARGKQEVDLSESFPDRRLLWGVGTITFAAGSAAFVTFDWSNPPGPVWLPSLAVAFVTSIWFFARVGLLRRPFAYNYRFHPALWRFWFFSPREAERVSSAWFLWAAGCMACVAYFSSFIRFVLLTW